MKFIIVILMLNGCATTQPAIQDNTELRTRLLKKYYDLQDHSYGLSFLMNMNTCFIYYNKCMIHIRKKEQCWTSHEKCVINTSNMHKTVKKKAKERRDRGE